MQYPIYIYVYPSILSYHLSKYSDTLSSPKPHLLIHFGFHANRKTAELKFRTPDGASVGMKLNGIEYKGHKAWGQGTFIDETWRTTSQTTLMVYMKYG